MANPEHVVENIEALILQFVDYLMPDLTPYETSLYLYLLRHSFLNGLGEVRVGKRTIVARFAKGSRGGKTSFAHISETLKVLEQKECIKIGDTTREGTLYIVALPKDIPLVREKMSSLLRRDTEENYFMDPDKRREVFERDKWTCQYCGEKVSEENATLDHFIPQSKGGKPSKDNLKASCLLCNAIKSGKTYQEAAPFLLKGIQERRARSYE